MKTLLVAPDSFRGTVTAVQVSRAVAETVFIGRFAAEWTCDKAPMADGGEGTLDVVSGRRRTTQVTGPLGSKIDAEWVMRGTTAVIEMAKASGLWLTGGPEGNNPLEATTTGTGELIAAAMRAGAEEVIVGVGGSATTDGGLGALKALWPQTRVREIELTVATDVDTLFIDAAREFAPQKGASPSQVQLLESRLRRLAGEYQSEFGVDVTAVPGSGAAGGLAGGLLAVGAKVVSGFEVLADVIDLDERVERADVVVTGEGCFDVHSMNGKVVGGIIDLAARSNKPVLVIAGQVDASAPDHFDSDVTVVSLTERFGIERALHSTLDCIREVVLAYLSEISLHEQS